MGLTRPRAAQIYDLDYKQATRVITVSNVTLTGGAPALVDGVSLVLGDRILVTGQTTASQNGLYDVTVVGVGSDGTWERTSDGNATGEILAGMIVMVTEGSIYADTQWKLTTDNPIVIGTTGLTFVINILSSVGGSNTQVQVNDGGTLAGFSNFVFDKTSNILSITGNISATGNVSGNYFLGNGSQLTGIAGAYGNTEVAAYLSSGNVTTAINTTSTISATGNITGNYFLGNGSQLSGIITTVDANTLIGNTLSSNIVNSSLTSVGTLGSLSVTGNIVGGNVISGGARAYKWTTQANTAPSNSVAGDNWYDSYADKLYLYINDGTGNQWVDQSPPTTFASLTITGNTSSGNLLTAGQVSAAGNIAGSYFIGNGSLLTNITGANVTGTVANATYAVSAGSATSATTAATVTTAAQANITSVGTLTSLSVTGTATLGNVNTGGTISATSNITAGNVLGGANVNATTHTGTTVSVTGTVTAGSLTVATGNITAGNLIISGSIQDSAQLDIQTTAGNANIVLTPNGTGNVNISANIMPTANATANIGSATSSFNTVFAKSTSAQYADLAEMYEADAAYAPGTVVEFGGDKEVTISNTPFSPLVMGVVSTNPAYLMNSTAQGKYMAAIALVGRVPTQVIGPVSKGAMMVSAGNGQAQSAAAPSMGTVIGKAVEDFTGESGVIEITIGRL